MKKTNYYTPAQIIERAKENMVTLESQKAFTEKIATLLSMHLAKVQALDSGNCDFNQLPCTSCFVVSPTGTGKSYLLKALTKASEMNVSFVDSTQLTQTGYKGCNLAESLSHIYAENVNFFDAPNVIVFDEFDKVFFNPHNEYYNASNPQRDLLKLFEGAEYTIKYERSGVSRNINISLNRTFVILAGACSGITEILNRKYAPKTAIGFSSSDTSANNIIPTDLFEKTDINDLISYGMLRELAGRVNTVLHIGALSRDDYITIINSKSKASAASQYHNLFSVRGCSFHITGSAAEEIANMAMERNLGARSISAILSEQACNAYSYLDSHPEYNKAIMTTCKDNRIVFNYIKGKRKEYETKKDVEERPLSRPLQKELSSNNSINHFCDEICSMASFANPQSERLMYYFLQTACRYLKENIRPKERTFDSLLKFANATDVPSGGYKSPYDIICNDYIEAYKKADKAENVEAFETFYNRFKKLQECGDASISEKSLLDAAKEYVKKVDEKTKIKIHN